MAHNGVFTTQDEILVKAGKGVNPDVATEARINALCVQVQGLINSIGRFNFVDNYSDLQPDTRAILSEVESDLVAIYLISYDMSGYTTRTEAENMINILRDAALRGLSILRDKKVQDYLKHTE